VKRFAEVTRDELFATLDDGLIITVNQRLARTLIDAYGERRRRDGDRAWRRPAIFSWEHWQQRLLQALGEDDRLLSEAQELHLWQQVIGENLSPDFKLQLQIPATARMAREAHRLLRDYGCDFAPENGSADHRVFLEWRKRWLSRLEELDALERAALGELLIEAFANGHVSPPAQLILAGFDDLRPLQLKLLELLVAQGTEIRVWSAIGDVSGERLLVAADDIHKETQLCARWVRRQLADGAAQVGVVVSDPQLYRRLVEEHLLAELAPAAYLHDGRVPGLLSFSLGGSLADEGVVAAALQLLALDEQLSFDQISCLLRSPWLGDLERDAARRMRLEHELRRSGEAYWSPRKLQQFRPEKKRAGGHGAAGSANELSPLAEQLSRSLAVRGKRQTAGIWSGQLLEFLAACSWPGQRVLSSRDFQAHEQFLELFSELAALERLGQPLSRGEAVSFLTRRAQERTFQVKEADGDIQVLGMLESSGLTFSHLWVLGMHDGAFPPTPRPNPFIPIPLQRARQMPHADAARELEFAASVAARLFSSAGQLVASYPRQGEVGEYQPSPFVVDFTPYLPELATASDPLSRIQEQPLPPETLVDSQAPAIASNRPVSGGTTLIKDQALCPFRAFVHHRLHCEGLATLDIGLDALQRGTLVHGMLENFWKQTSGHAALLQLGEAGREQSLRRGAEQAIASLERENRRDIPPDVREIELERIVRLGLEWLEVEARRSPFTVQSLEKRHECGIGKLSIRTQVDRVDALESGGVAVIDYKTGTPDPGLWLEERIAEPQLPVYVQEFGAEQVSAVLFAQVRRGECRYRGVSRQADLIPGVPGRRIAQALEVLALDFDALLQRWGELLPRLGDAFVAGDAAVAPLEGEKTCRYCDCHSLCRILELGDGGSGGRDA